MLSAVNWAPGRGLRCLSASIASLMSGQVEAGSPLDDRQAVVLDVFQVVVDQHAQHVAVRRLRRSTCSSRHSCRSRAPTPGGSSFCTMLQGFFHLLERHWLDHKLRAISSSGHCQVAVLVDVA